MDTCWTSSNARYAAFVENCLGFDPYERYRGSKAVILRQIWSGEPSGEVARLNAELLEYWRVNKLATGQEPTRFEQEVYTELLGFFRQETAPAVSPADLAFLDKDFASLDLGALPSELTSAKIVDARLSEIERCVDADAPLAVIFFVGSTLEGLLMAMALAHPDQYTASTSAPRKAGEIKPIPSWTLAELIVVSRDLGILGADVLKHADHVREFRNYIHPRQQLAESFEPRAVTAQIARQVLHAALADLQALSANLDQAG